jgi:hypothetical protein
MKTRITLLALLSAGTLLSVGSLSKARRIYQATLDNMPKA